MQSKNAVMIRTKCDHDAADYIFEYAMGILICQFYDMLEEEHAVPCNAEGL